MIIFYVDNFDKVDGFFMNIEGHVKELKETIFISGLFRV